MDSREYVYEFFVEYSMYIFLEKIENNENRYFGKI